MNRRIFGFGVCLLIISLLLNYYVIDNYETINSSLLFTLVFILAIISSLIIAIGIMSPSNPKQTKESD